MNEQAASDREITAMAAIAAALGPFRDDEHAIVERILRWACDRYDVTDIDERAGDGRQVGNGGGDAQARADSNEHVADLVDKFAPTSAGERALVVGYWLQVSKQQREFTGYEVNACLKDLGHRVGNITDALASLTARTPSLVIQTRKHGTTRQARKKYKLTGEGVRAVQERLRERMPLPA